MEPTEITLLKLVPLAILNAPLAPMEQTSIVPRAQLTCSELSSQLQSHKTLRPSANLTSSQMNSRKQPNIQSQDGLDGLLQQQHPHGTEFSESAMSIPVKQLMLLIQETELLQPGEDLETIMQPLILAPTKKTIAIQMWLPVLLMEL